MSLAIPGRLRHFSFQLFSGRPPLWRLRLDLAHFLPLGLLQFVALLRIKPEFRTVAKVLG